MLSYKFAKKYFKQLYILREILEWPGELFWDLCEKHWRLNNWFIQDFYKFPQNGKKSRWETVYNKDWQTYWEWGNLPYDLRYFYNRTVRKFIGKLCVPKSCRRILDHFTWEGKLITDDFNHIQIRTYGPNTIYYDFTCIFGFWKVLATRYDLRDEKGVNLFAQSLLALGKTEEELEETELQTYTREVYKGFVNKKNLLSFMKTIKKDFELES